MQSSKGTMTAQSDWVIVEKFTHESTTTESGIIVNDNEDPDLGRVLSVGSACCHTDVKVGSIVAPDWSKAVLVRHLTCAVRVMDITAVVTPVQH